MKNKLNNKNNFSMGEIEKLNKTNFEALFDLEKFTYLFFKNKKQDDKIKYPEYKKNEILIDFKPWCFHAELIGSLNSIKKIKFPLNSRSRNGLVISNLKDLKKYLHEIFI